jgi:MFS family permease
MPKGNFFSFFKYWTIATPEFKRLVIGLLFLALFNSSDIFLLLKTREVTGSDQLTIGAYILYNLVYALASFPMGILADRIGTRQVLVSGLAIFSLVYYLFGTTHSAWVIGAAFVLYGVYAAATEGIAKAWITNTAHNANTATAVGFYTSCESICTLLASVIAGGLWTGFGSKSTFMVTAGAAIVSMIYLLINTQKRVEK